ncbi:MAG: YraN family protein [Clostridia bacterium]|nr:YraN family protein [Clostridia bacterium]
MEILKVKTERRRLGDLGERAAARYLFFRGYRILCRSYVANGKEIDIIARGHGYTVFCEVKTRTLGTESAFLPRPASAVTARKQQGIISAARVYASELGTRGSRMRFDCIEVFVDGSGKRPRVKKINHLKSAFSYDTAYGRK